MIMSTKVDEAKADDDIVVDRSCIGYDNCGIDRLFTKKMCSVLLIVLLQVSAQGMVSIIGNANNELMISLRSLLYSMRICVQQSLSSATLDEA